MIIKHYITGISLIILNAVFLCFGFPSHESFHNVILLKPKLTLTNILSDKFLSFGLDSSLLRDMDKLPINDKKFVNLARHLSPAYVRFGGTSANCLYFNQTTEKLVKIDSDTVFADVNTSNFSINSNDFISLYQFTENANLRMIFDLNVLIRNTIGSWNSDNVKEIISFAKKHGMKLDWQMGNEPNSYSYVFNITISPEQLARDFCKLRSLLNNSGYKNSILVGPEVNHIEDDDHSGEIYAQSFLREAKDCIDDVTWHQYYLNGRIAQVQDFIDPATFNILADLIERVDKVIETSGQAKNMWISETSSAYGGGARNISDRFVASFLWLDKLGYSAKTNVQVVIRQSLFGGSYGLVGRDLNPNPDWWVSVMFKKLVSNKVLDLETPNNLGKLRMYAHCATEEMTAGLNSSLVIYGVNLNAENTRIYLHIPTNETYTYAYMLTSKDLQSRDIFLNEKILKLNMDGSLPEFKPKILDINEVIELPPYSLAFFLLHQVPTPVCSN